VRLTIFSFAMVLLPGMIDAQKRVVVKSEPSCPRCTIELVPVTRIVFDGKHKLRPQMAMAVDARGRIVAGVTTPEHYHLALYDDRGRPVTDFARQGQGPAEVYELGFVIVREPDSIIAFDMMKLHHFSNQGQHRRTVPVARLSVARSAVRIPGGRWVIAGDLMNDPDEKPLHMISDGGALLKSFGVPVEQRNPQVASALRMRMLASADSGHFWAAHVEWYEMDLFRNDGSLERTIVRNAEWFPPAQPKLGLGSGPAKPRLLGVHQDPEGLLWTVVWVPTKADAATGRGGRNREARTELGPSWYAERYTTVVEVIDPRSNRLIVSRPLQWMQQVQGAGLVITSEVDSAGVETICVSQLQLRKQKPERKPGK
jgi:hypothetical protein